ncbi:DUF397 domain-containing protein [Streptomyces sp. NPDC051104]|uniref:DUF397 domain-containing protein n=1 Tax=Streptomyces sp. NPDC051104 TaxID=3155044 RepID=UPI00341CBB85
MIRETAVSDTCELTWFKSSYSDGPEGDSCVEIAIAPRAVHVRDSKHVPGPRLTLPPEAWTRFVAYASEG